MLLDELYDAREIAASIAGRGYFPSEVVIGVIGEDPDTVVVVEGNRRLAAAKGLAFPEFRRSMSEPAEWERLATVGREKGTTPQRIPVLIEPDRDAIIATIGYRHISGIKAWEPYQQARYIAERVDLDGLSLREVAELTGTSLTEVRSKYRNYGIVRAAEEAGIDPALVQESFGVWDAALGRVPIRQFVGARDPGQIVAGEPVIQTDHMDQLSELIGWLFGPNKKIRESRDLGTLADVISSPVGLEVLRGGRTLQESLDATRMPRNPQERVTHALTSSLTSLGVAVAQLGAMPQADQEQVVRDPRVRQVISEIHASAEELSELL